MYVSNFMMLYLFDILGSAGIKYKYGGFNQLKFHYTILTKHKICSLAFLFINLFTYTNCIMMICVVILFAIYYLIFIIINRFYDCDNYSFMLKRL